MTLSRFSVGFLDPVLQPSDASHGSFWPFTLLSPRSQLKSQPGWIPEVSCYSPGT